VLQRVVLFYLPFFTKGWFPNIPILFLPPKTLIGILLGGMILGFLGSFMAAVRFLKARE